LSDTELRNDFAAYVNLFQDFIGQRSSMAGGPEVNISAIKTQDGKERGKEKGNAEMSVEDCYYEKEEEYFKLTPAQKNGLQLKRKKRGHVTNKNKKKSAKSLIKSGKSLTGKQAKALIAAILYQGDTSQDETNNAGHSTSDSESESEGTARKKVRFAEGSN